MFAVIYRIWLKPHREEEYKRAWKALARYFIEQRGAIGSCLHRAEEGYFVAYSRWPDKKTRDASWNKDAPPPDLPPSIQQAILTLKECADPDRTLPEICMELCSLEKNQPLDYIFGPL